MFSTLDGDDNFMSLGDPYYMYLVDKPRKIMWNTFFDFSFDFSIVFGLMKRAQTFLVMFIFVLFYSQACEPYVAVFHKLLWALTMSDLMRQVLKL